MIVQVERNGYIFNSENDFNSRLFHARFKGGGKTPPTPPPPDPAPVPEAPVEAGETEAKRLSRLRGRKQTFLTGDLIPEQKTLEFNTLLGGK